jgi:hypothetical protein
MMTRFVLTLVLGVLLSLGAVVTVGFFGQAQAGNWNKDYTVNQEGFKKEIASHVLEQFDKTGTETPILFFEPGYENTVVILSPRFDYLILSVDSSPWFNNVANYVRLSQNPHQYFKYFLKIDHFNKGSRGYYTSGLNKEAQDWESPVYDTQISSKVIDGRHYVLIKSSLIADIFDKLPQSLAIGVRTAGQYAVVNLVPNPDNTTSMSQNNSLAQAQCIELGFIAGTAKYENCVARLPIEPAESIATVPSIKQTPTQVNDPLAEAKATCSDLGFASGTEKYGNCVLKIAGNSGSEVASASIEAETVSSNDTKAPAITIALAFAVGPEGTIKGYVRDNASIAEVRVDGQLVKVDRDGNFSANTYVPEGGVSVSIQAIDLAGLSSSMSVRLDRSASTTTASISFERLNPLGRKVAKNKDALALIIGVDGYKSTPARAIYADSDAKVFTDYASQKLGIPTNRIKTLVNDGAGEREMLLSVKSWLSRASKQGKSDVYVFFAGHGLASDDGQKMYLLPYDGAPELLDDTAILRDRLFSDIASANPRSVTVFLDTCYSGTTRGTDMLIASRPIAIKALEQSIPDNFTVMTAARGDQTAKPLEEAKHGMFSYFLMKGMEGEADQNKDNKITAGELHQYVEQNVVQQSSGSQTPELQGDADRVLVRFQ